MVTGKERGEGSLFEDGGYSSRDDGRRGVVSGVVSTRSVTRSATLRRRGSRGVTPDTRPSEVVSRESP